jgi:phytoene dehydrogenase-like protein
VGAGFAGLAAAEALATGGAEVTVFEARDRVGGRVHSGHLENGAVVELGAEFVLPGYDALRETTARLGLTLYEKCTLYGDREPRDGPPVTRAGLLAADASLRGAGSGSIADALERLVPSPGARAAVAARLAVSSAYELEDLDAAALAEGAARFGDSPVTASPVATIGSRSRSRSASSAPSGRRPRSPASPGPPTALRCAPAATR